MLFNSLTFALFFPLALGGYWLLPARFRWLWLLLTSCTFYMAFVPVYVLILFAVIGIDYTAGLLIARSEGATRKRWLGLSIVANLAVLGLFKYYNFFAENVRSLADLIGWNLPLPVLQLLLPIGLSFHVFQSLSYTIEVYRGALGPERHLGIYAVYVMFWPQLVAGPIERPQNLLPQFHTPKAFDPDAMAMGLRRMAWGLFKKMVIADRLSLVVDPIFAHPEAHSGVTLCVAAVFFAVQIYCDFSGYSDIALGAAETMNVKLMENFRRPYFARDLQAFWARWHISLSTWFRDYVYFPLGGSRVPRGRASLNMLTVFLVSGLWHGANWTFIVWGALHGLVLVGLVWTRELRARLALSPLVGILLTAGFVTIAWIPFRAASLADAATFVSRMPLDLLHQLTHPAALRDALHALGHSVTSFYIPVGLILILIAVEAVQERVGAREWLALRPTWQRHLLYQAMLLAIFFLGVFENRSFIYFQF